MVRSLGDTSSVVVGDVARTTFWQDAWLRGEPLCPHFPSLFSHALDIKHNDLALKHIFMKSHKFTCMLSKSYVFWKGAIRAQPFNGQKRHIRFGFILKNISIISKVT